MAKITRKQAKIFGGSAGVGEIGVFGSLAAGAVNTSTDLDTIQSLSQWLGGWFDAVIGNNSPAMEDMNAVLYVLAYQIAYTLQTGVPEWNTSTPYYIGSIVNDGTGKLFISRTDDNTGNAVTSTTHWRPFVQDPSNVTINPASTPTRTLNASDNGKTFLVTTANGAFALTLPAASDGYYFTIKDISGSAQTNAITVTRAGSESIEGVASNYSANKNWGAWTFVSNGTNWFVTKAAFNSRLANAAAAGYTLRSGSSSDAAPIYDSNLQIDPSTGKITFNAAAAGSENHIKGHTRIGDSASSITPNNVSNRFIGNQKAYVSFPDAATSPNIYQERGSGIYTPDLATYTRLTSGVAGTIERMRPGTASTDAIWELLSTAIGGTTTTLTQRAAVLQSGLFAVSSGVQFPASQVASSGANDLDDYEEGTFTPTLAFDTPGTSSFGYTTNSGKYTKIGDRVDFNLTVLVNAFTKGTASGAWRVLGLPFAAARFCVAAFYMSDQTFAGIPTFFTGSGNTWLKPEVITSNATTVTMADPDSNTFIVLSGTYFV